MNIGTNSDCFFMSIIQLRAIKQTYKNNPTFKEGRFFVFVALSCFFFVFFSVLKSLLLRHLTVASASDSSVRKVFYRV